MSALFQAPGQLLGHLDFTAFLGQSGRLLKVETALPSLALVPERVVMKEALGQPFELTLDALSTNAYFELKGLIGEQISVRLLQADGSYRPWHGYVLEAGQLGSDGGLARYRLVMRPWLAFLAHRRNSVVFHDKSALAVLEAVFEDHPQANYRLDVGTPLRQRSLCTQYRESDLDFITRLLAEEGLSYHFEHLDGQAASEADARGHARHVLVVTDAEAERADLGPVRFARVHATANIPGQRDAITTFSASRVIAPNAVALGSWDYTRLTGSAAQDASALDLGDLPRLEVYDGAGAYRYEDAAHAERAARLSLAAHELDHKRFEGRGSARHFEPGRTFSLVDHPLYGANTTALNYPGALTASRRRADNQFTLLSVEHHCANNLGAQAARLLGPSGIEHGIEHDIERGSYACAFECAPAAAAVVPHHRRRPTAGGPQTALVVGLEGEAATTDREHRVKVRFAWQRGTSTPDGASSNGADSDAPPDATGTWVRVALPAAGANWGAVFTPRLGSEVGIDFIEGDIDRPVIVGQLYNGQDTPPFAAGVDSGVNHPGVISGLHTHGLDGAGGGGSGDFNQWAVDDASGQLRMRLLCSYAQAELGLGHLIQQSASSANRGAWRGSGFEATTQGWASVRAAKGLLISSTARAGTYGSAEGTQMDAAEALAVLRGGRQLGQRLSEAARAATAQGLSSFEPDRTVQKLLDRIDPKKEGRHPATVNGQDARQAGSDGRTLTAPVEAFAAPVIVIDTPSTAAWVTEAGIAAFAGQDHATTAQGDVHHTAARSWASVSGKTTSWYVHAGGIKAYAANGPVSVRAHTDALQLLADKEVTVVSVNGEIRVSASTKIELIAGQSSITLEGANIEFKTPGAFTVKGSGHAFLGGGSGAVDISRLPDSTVKLFDEAFLLRDPQGEVISAVPFKITAADGVETGRSAIDGNTLRVSTQAAEALKFELRWNDLQT